MVNETTGRTLTLGASTVRLFGYLVSILCIWIGFIWILFDR